MPIGSVDTSWAKLGVFTQQAKNSLAVAIEERPIDCYIDKANQSNIMLTGTELVDAKSKELGECFQI